jgi:hypothetical protein
MCACMLGLSMGEAGVSIMHDVNHGAGLPSKRARYVLGAAMDLVSLFLLGTATDCHNFVPLDTVSDCTRRHVAFSSCHACCKEDVTVLMRTPLLSTEAL